MDFVYVSIFRGLFLDTSLVLLRWISWVLPSISKCVYLPSFKNREKRVSHKLTQVLTSLLGPTKRYIWKRFLFPLYRVVPSSISQWFFCRIQREVLTSFLFFFCRFLTCFTTRWRRTPSKWRRWVAMSCTLTCLRCCAVIACGPASGPSTCARSVETR